jgi:arylsulfatase B
MLGTVPILTASSALHVPYSDGAGYGIPGWGGNPTQTTPALDALRAEGLTFENNYVYQFCSPTRGALLTGRYPWKLPQSIYNFLPATYLEGTPIEYTMLPKKLATAGYVSSHVGKVGRRVRSDLPGGDLDQLSPPESQQLPPYQRVLRSALQWHLGLYAPQFTPLGRGFNTSYGFLTGGEDHFTQVPGERD